MAVKYKLVNPAIKTVPAGKMNEGNEYFIADMENQDDVFAADQQFTSFEERVVKAIKAALPVKQGGLNTDPNAVLPEKMQYIYGDWEQVEMQTPFYKQYLNTEYGHEAGDLVSDAQGNPVEYNSLDIFVRKYIDSSTGQWVHPKGGSAELLAKRQFTQMCVAINHSNTPSVTAPAKDTEKRKRPELPPPGFKYLSDDPYDMTMAPAE